MTQLTSIRCLPVAIGMVGMFMAILDSYIVVVAGPSLQRDLGLSSGELQWTLAGYQLAYAVLMVIGARLADLYGHRRIFLIGITVFTVASVACALSDGAHALIAARVIQGLGAALMVPQVFALISILVPETRRPGTIAVLGVVIGSATIAGQVLGGLLIGLDAGGSGWRAIFWVNVPIGLVTFALAYRFIDETRGAGSRRLDLPGAATLTAALLLLVYPLIQGREQGWPAWTWVSFAASRVVFTLFAAIERREAASRGEPLIAMALFRERTFSVGIALVIAVYALLTSYYLALAVALQEGLGLSALESGLAYAPAAFTFCVFGIVAGRLIPRHGRRVLEAGSVLLVPAYLAMAVLLLVVPALPVGLWIPLLMIQAVGGGLLITPSLGTVLSGIEPASAGMASGALSTAQQVGAAIGVAAIGTLFFGVFDPADSALAESGRHAFAIASFGAAVIAGVAALLVFALPGSRR